MKFIIIFAALIFCKVNCKVGAGDVCQIDGVDFGIAKPPKKCDYFDDVRKLPRAEKRTMMQKIKITGNLICCKARISSRACAAFGVRPEKPSKDRRRITKRIVGGLRARPGEFPHVAALAYVEKTEIHFKCGGALISERFVLTAAHCCPKADPPVIVRLGRTSLDLNDTSDPYKFVDIDVKNTINNPKYKSHEKYHDIALIEMKQPASFSFNVWPSCINVDVLPKYGSNFTIAGFGIIDAERTTTSNWLMKGIIHEIPLKACQERLEKEFGTPNKTGARIDSVSKLGNGIIKEMICALNRDGKQIVDTCQGDSGTALQFKHDSNVYVYGITSFGFSCNTRLPSFYTRALSYIDWIESIVWKESN